MTDKRLLLAIPIALFILLRAPGLSQGRDQASSAELHFSFTPARAELRRLMLENVHTAAGEVVTRSFIVNVRTPRIASGGEVHLKVPRESVEEAWEWDDRLTLELNGARPCVDAMEISPVQVPSVFILGDSTVCDQPREPYGIRQEKLDLASHLDDEVPPLDRAHPDPVVDFKVPPSPNFTNQRPLGD